MTVTVLEAFAILLRSINIRTVKRSRPAASGGMTRTRGTFPVRTAALGFAGAGFSVTPFFLKNSTRPGACSVPMAATDNSAPAWRWKFVEAKMSNPPRRAGPSRG